MFTFRSLMGLHFHEEILEIVSWSRWLWMSLCLFIHSCRLLRQELRPQWLRFRTGCWHPQHGMNRKRKCSRRRQKTLHPIGYPAMTSQYCSKLDWCTKVLSSLLHAFFFVSSSLTPTRFCSFCILLSSYDTYQSLLKVKVSWWWEHASVPQGEEQDEFSTEVYIGIHFRPIMGR